MNGTCHFSTCPTVVFLHGLCKMKPNIHAAEFKPPTDLLKPVVLPIMSINASLVNAALVLWKSWLWQCHNADSRSKLKPGVRPVVLDPLENNVGVVA